ncbi:autotransporter-associated beta strand repeat-containing protein, partial [Haloferula sp. BvORR071]|uniref:beta strand repeat-containing protein n=1 Tax=Haloferula sp. BvORR071 TaxID=1396141 RepID=UPI0005570015
MDTRSYAFLFAVIATGAGQAQDLRSTTLDNLNLPAAWSDGSPPLAADTATWNAASALANTLGANLTWGGLNVSAASGAVSIGGANTLTAGAINLGANNLTLTTSAANNSLNFSSLSGSGRLTVANGTSNLGVAAFNTANALNFNGTLALRGGNAATTPAAVGGSFFYLGRTGITQAAGTSFSLDTGAGATDAKDVILDSGSWGGKTINLSSLSGYGALRRDSGSGASTVTLSVNQASDTVFNGLVLAHTGTNNTDIRQLSITKDGIGSLTLAGVVGKQTQSGGSNSANVNLTIAGGTLILGANNTRTGTTTVNAAGTLQIGNGGTIGTIGADAVANDGALVFNYGTGAAVSVANVISGSGTLAKRGAGTVILSGISTLSGATTVEGGTLKLGGDLASSAVTVNSGAKIAAGTAAQAGAGFVKTLTLVGGSASEFRAGSVYDLLVVNQADGLLVSGPHTITAISTGGLNFGDRIPIIDYSGSFTGFANLSLAPGSRFALVNNTTDTQVELEYKGGTLQWTGGTGVWEAGGATNWNLGGSPASYLQGDLVEFVNGASTGSVSLTGTLTPGAVTVANSTLAYTLGGSGSLGGTGDFTKQGTGTATVTAATSYTGSTFVEEGSLTFGDGATSGQIGSGPVAVSAGAVLKIHRSDLLDYKTSPHLRTVSGEGEIRIDGGGTVFSYPGTGIGFSEGSSWAGFSGNLVITNGSEFQTIRNGATAMGSGDVVLGDTTTSGKLSQIEGNWTWTNDIVLNGADNKIINRSVGTNRSMKLQGIISGSGNLTIEDPAAAMTNNLMGFILTGESTMSGTLTIPTGVPVRIGGVPGNTDINQGGAGPAGSLGGVTVVNEGTLSFTRTDALTVGNAISGGGQVFIGLPTGSDAQEVTFTGAKSYSGFTTVRSGKLLLNTTLPSSPVLVDAGGTLGGSGTVATASAVSGTLAPGNGVGTLTFGDSLSLDAGSRIAWQISDWNGTAGSGYDKIQTGTLTIGATTASPLTIVITPESLANFSETPKTFTLVSTSGGISGLDAGEIVIDHTAFPGTGSWSVQVVGNALQLSYSLGNAYNAWESANGISGAGANADSDHDGIPNGVEFVIGGDPSDSDSSALAPVITVDASYLNFVFRRTDDSASFNPAVQYGSSLGAWTTAQPGVPSENPVLIQEVNNFYGAGIDQVTVKIPRGLVAPGTKLF